MEKSRQQDFYRKYSNINIPELEFATVRDFADSKENFPELCIQQDLKDVERPWAVKAILDRVPKGSKLLEIGGGEPIVSDFLYQLGYDITLIDPFEGDGNGPIRYQHFKKKYPNVKIIKGLFNNECNFFPEKTFDCIFSISVLEHIPEHEISSVFKGISKFSKRNSYTIHNIDHIHLGNGADWSLRHLNTVLSQLNLNEEWKSLQLELEINPEIFFLSPQGHLLWKGDRSYNEFPFRRCVAVNVCKKIND